MRQEFFIETEPKAQARPRSRNMGLKAVWDPQRRRFVYKARTITYDPLSSRIFKRLVRTSVAASQPEMFPDVALTLIVEFFMRRPKAHYGVKGLKSTAPHYHKAPPDADNLLKGVKDALKGLLYRDDCLIAVELVIKRYGETPGINIVIQEAK